MDNRLILLVEDSAADVRVTKRAFQKAGMDNPVEHVDDGRRAINYLHLCKRPGGTERPALILLDLNLPGMDGREVLRSIKSADDFRAIPVVVLSTSDDERDVRECYRLGANSYIKKPLDLPGFVDAMQTLNEFWFDTAIVPN
ncbi:MAG: response regulator [Alphaproteobacteria bacterium]|nr:MAG: response regulator [Alphaproteobacteria bacterium]